MICMKNLRFSSRPRAKVRRQGPPGSARAQPCYLTELSKDILGPRFVQVIFKDWSRFEKCITSYFLVAFYYLHFYFSVSSQFF